MRRLVLVLALVALAAGAAVAFGPPSRMQTPTVDAAPAADAALPPAPIDAAGRRRPRPRGDGGLVTPLAIDGGHQQP